DDEGRLVGICFAADYEGNEGLYTALESIHDELDRVGLSAVYQSAGGAPPSRGNLASRPVPNNETVIRGQEPSPQVMPTSAVVEASPGAPGAMSRPNQPAASAPAALSANENAALEEIMARASSSEVVCIIRPKDAGGKSEVITLDNVSPEFVRELAKRSAAAGTSTR